MFKYHLYKFAQQQKGQPVRWPFCCLEVGFVSKILQNPDDIACKCLILYLMIDYISMRCIFLLPKML